MSQNKNDWYFSIKGKKVSVTEEVYRVMYQAKWREDKQARLRSEREESLDLLQAEGKEFSNDSNSIADIVVDKLLKKDLHTAIEKLSADERKLIYALFLWVRQNVNFQRKLAFPKQHCTTEKTGFYSDLKSY